MIQVIVFFDAQRQRTKKLVYNQRIKNVTMMHKMKVYVLQKLSSFSFSKGLLVFFIAWCLFLIFRDELSFQFTVNPPPKPALEIIDYPIKEPPFIDPLDEIKASYLNIPNVAFHYADEVQIESFYQEYFKEPHLQQQIQEDNFTDNQRLKGAVEGVVEGELHKEGSKKRVSTLKYPEKTLNGKFLRYQQAMIMTDQVSIGLEELDIELGNVAAFQRLMEHLFEDYNFSIDPNKVLEHENYLKAQAAEKTLESLQNARDWTLIKGTFQITKTGSFYKLVFEHPVNAYLQREEKLLITTMIPIEGIEPTFAANYQQSLESNIPITLYGKIWKPIDLKEGQYELMITPMAIY